MIKYLGAAEIRNSDLHPHILKSVGQAVQVFYSSCRAVSKAGSVLTWWGSSGTGHYVDVVSTENKEMLEALWVLCLLLALCHFVAQYVPLHEPQFLLWEY